MSTFAITSHQYTITLYTPGYLEISWEVFTKKSADILSFRISFITISSTHQKIREIALGGAAKRAFEDDQGENGGGGMGNLSRRGVRRVDVDARRRLRRVGARVGTSLRARPTGRARPVARGVRRHVRQ